MTFTYFNWMYLKLVQNTSQDNTAVLDFLLQPAQDIPIKPLVGSSRKTLDGGHEICIFLSERQYDLEQFF